MKNKYFNHAIIGNKNLVASFSDKGELLRLYHPQTDFNQFIDFFGVGMKINDSGMIYFHEDINNSYEQHYIEDTNVLLTNIVNNYFNVEVMQIDFVPTKENVLVKRYILKNMSKRNLNIDVLVHSKLLNSCNNKVSGIFRDNILMQYTHDYTFAILSSKPVLNYQINNSEQNIGSGIIGGKDYVGMSDDSSISYNMGEFKPGEQRQIDIIISINPNHDSNIVDKLEKIRKLNIDKELDNTKRYWKKYVKEHSKIYFDTPNNEYKRKIKEIYNRSILLFPLLTNHTTGGISAAMEIDENLTKCGRYAYCWPRDAVFIAKAFDEIGMEKEVDKFYLNFCKNTQSRNGMWEQRFYTDGNLAPAWGYQIDETASVVYGIYEHYLHTQNIEFIKNSINMCNKAIKYLEKYLEEVLKNENILASYDLWEENVGIHTYSLASIYAAFAAKIEINKVYKIELEKENTKRLQIDQLIEEEKRLEENLVKIKDYIVKNLYDDKKKSFVRNKDGKIDISLLGLVYPFKLFSSKEKKITNTIERMDMTIRTYTGGYLRYEKDNYCGGNPWVISNLWMANYYLDKGQKKKAEECFKFAVNSATPNGFLPEQVDNSTMKAKWVIGLGWSHAMFITTLSRLMK